MHSQLLKQPLEIVATDEGIRIERMAEHFSNADSPRIAIRQPESNVNIERHSQLLKENLESVSTDEGMETD
jgi:hypothetical protein